MKKTILKREGKPYLIRWTLLTTPWFTIKLHKLLMSDPVDLHDHPWSYMSVILWGGYNEVRVGAGTYSCKWFRPGSILLRKASSPHRLELLPKTKFSLSLIITTGKYRDWGFMKDGVMVSHKQSSY